MRAESPARPGGERQEVALLGLVGVQRIELERAAVHQLPVLAEQEVAGVGQRGARVQHPVVVLRVELQDRLVALEQLFVGHRATSSKPVGVYTDMISRIIRSVSPS